MIKLARTCYVPHCEETYDEKDLFYTSGGWMCPKHYHSKIVAEFEWTAFQYPEDSPEREKWLNEAKEYKKGLDI